MCVVSMIMDHYDDEWRRKYTKPDFSQINWDNWQQVTSPITQAEIDEFRRLLDRAREYDKRNNEPNCEMESKKQKLRELAKELGIIDKLKFLDEPDV